MTAACGRSDGFSDRRLSTTERWRWQMHFHRVCGCRCKRRTQCTRGALLFDKISGGCIRRTGPTHERAFGNGRESSANSGVLLTITDPSRVSARIAFLMETPSVYYFSSGGGFGTKRPRRIKTRNDVRPAGELSCSIELPNAREIVSYATSTTKR